MTLCQAPPCIGAFYYLKFFIYKDDKTKREANKKKLPNAHMLNIISHLLQLIWGIVGGLLIMKTPMFIGGAAIGAQAAAAAANPYATVTEGGDGPSAFYYLLQIF